MDITPTTSSNKKVINAYKKGYFTINDNEYKGSVIVFPELVVSFPELNVNNTDHLSRFSGANIEVILVGTGAKHTSPSLLVKNYAHKQNFEFMSTGAACRTYNILLSEERYVIAILMAM